MLLLAGFLALVVGALLLYRPIAGLASLTLLIACYLFASGLFRAVISIVDRYQSWGWDLASRENYFVRFPSNQRSRWRSHRFSFGGIETGATACSHFW
jgi:hypothetical protein